MCAASFSSASAPVRARTETLVPAGVLDVHVDDKVRRYITQIVHDTRECDELSLGASPRASIFLARFFAAVESDGTMRPSSTKRSAISTASSITTRPRWSAT